MVEFIIDEVGGNDVVKVLFWGRIVKVERCFFKGHLYGIVYIVVFDDDDNDEIDMMRCVKVVVVGGMFKIFFKNENIFVEYILFDGKFI